MPKGNPSRTALLGAAAIAMIALLAGCGSGASDTSSTTAATPSVSDFPGAGGRSLEEIAKGSGGSPSNLIAAPAGQVFRPGKNRYGFGVFNVDGSSVPDAQVALYAARPGRPAEGPFPAAPESLAVAAPYQSKTASQDPDAAKNVYVAEIPFDKPGQWDLIALFKDGSNYSYTSLNTSAVVDPNAKVPAVGDKAPVIHTLTAKDVGGDISKIDTRQPPDTMHYADFADEVGKKPIVLLFATPALCQSRVCGPVADITEEVKNERPDDAVYIHQEIYNDNEIAKGTQEQVNAYNLPSEPWLFVINTDGRISTEIEGAFSKGELEAAIDKADQESGVTPSGDSRSG